MTGAPARLVLVVGCPRSGTTWLQRLLLTHPEITGPTGESFLFVALRRWWGNIGSSDGTGVPAWQPDVAAVTAATRRFCDRLLGLDETRAALVLEKTPAHVHELDTVRALYPDVRVIHIVRDGRDVVRSLVELEFGVDDVRSAAQAWTDALAAAASHSGSVDLREVRYEDLLADPVAGTTDLFGWLGLPVDAAVRAEIAAGAATRVSQYNTTGAVGAGKWRSLGARELSTVYAVAGPQLVDHGYLTAAELTRLRRRPRVVLETLRGRRRRGQPSATTGGGRSAGGPSG